MNERIKELAEQCYEKHELLGTYEFNKEKFAQLIVQECTAPTKRDLRKAAEQALEALEKQHNWMVANDGMFQIPSRKAIQALRQALAQSTWHCPLKKPDCKENCGSYGCGN